MADLLDAVFGTAPSGQPVRGGACLERILRLPQRDPAPLAEALVGPLTAMLRQPAGSMELHPLQALALAEAQAYRGLVAFLPVGEGKTLITYLLPRMLGCEGRAVLAVPGSKVVDTEADFRELARHWQGTPPRVVSTNAISDVPGLLESLDPELLILDEAHMFSGPDSGRRKRLIRFMRKRRPKPILCVLSGTLHRRSFDSWWHLQQMALPPQLQPLPYRYHEVQDWCDALGAKPDYPRPVGDLARFGPEPRKGYAQILRRVPGVIISDGEGAASCKAELHLRLLRARCPAILSAIATMQRTWCTPDGTAFSEALDLARHTRTLASGFYSVWDPQPPDWWLQPRQEYHRFIRTVLGHSRKYDTPSQVEEAYPQQHEIRAWRAIEHQFRPNPVPRWIDHTPLHVALAWAEAKGGLVWTAHGEVGRTLDAAGLPYFSSLGLDARGNSIREHKGPACVSLKAVGTGFNLQRYDCNLFLSVLSTGDGMQQVLGRTHRQHQISPVVTADVLALHAIVEQDLDQATKDAIEAEETTGQKQKLTQAKRIAA